MIRSSRIGIIHLSLAAFALAVIVKAADVQLVQGGAWAARAENEHVTKAVVPAPRGEILDATGRKLAESRDLVTLSIAPREVRNLHAMANGLLRAGVDRLSIAHATDTTHKWVVVPGRFVVTEVAALMAMHGVYADAVSERAYLSSDETRRVVGHVDAQGKAVDGLELALDSLLRGRDGAAALVRDVHGRSFASPTSPGVPPVKGSTVVLTLNAELQQITERALDDAVSRMGAESGDIVILDPATGDVLAMASRGADARSTAATALTEPFEPGSTIKPLVAAALLARDRVQPTDMVKSYGGQLTINGRTIHDEPHEGPPQSALSLADVIRESSNVGIVQFAQRLSAAEQYEALRDFGFGNPTGLPYPSESHGTLRSPHTWSTQSANSMAMGYEIAVTPMQLAVAYAAIANGGELLEPAIVKEIRGPDGRVRYRHERRVVRRVMPRNVAANVRGMLRSVVENGTAVQADLANYLLGGKTGTPRRTVNGHYAHLEYNPNFVGLFPGNAPQFVIVVKISNPKGSYYSAKTAAPLTKTILEAALAARDAALDRGQLARASVVHGRSGGGESTRVAAAGDNAAVAPAAADTQRAVAARELSARAESVTISLPAAPAPADSGRPSRAVPDVRGLPLRDAVRALHDAGFRVQLVHGGGVQTWPSAGASAPAGAVVRLQHDG